MKTLVAVIFLSCGLGAEAVGQLTSGPQKINGTQLYLEVEGTGDPLVIIHGGPALSHDYFLPHLEVLGRDNKLVYYDQRASGRSVIPPPDSLSMHFFIEDLEAIRKMLAVEHLNIFAHSWGAIVAVNYGIAYPDHIGKMILCNPVPLSKGFDQEMASLQSARATSSDSTDRSIIMGSPDFKAGKPSAYSRLMYLSFRHLFYEPSNLKKLDIQLQDNYLAASQALYAGLGPDLADYNYYDELQAFKFPVLILRGTSDGIPEGATDLMMSNLPHGTLVDFKQSGHFIFIEEPKKFGRTVNAFLK